MNSPEARDIYVVRGVLPSIDTADDSVLVLHRHGNHKRNSDKWEFPGGQVDITNQDPFPALAEQILNKTGIEVGFKDPSLSCVELRTMENGALYIAYAATVRYLRGGLETLPEEHDDAAWVDLSVLGRYPLTSQAQTTLSLLRNNSLGVIDLAGPRAVQLNED